MLLDVSKFSSFADRAWQEERTDYMSKTKALVSQLQKESRRAAAAAAGGTPGAQSPATSPRGVPRVPGTSTPKPGVSAPSGSAVAARLLGLSSAATPIISGSGTSTPNFSAGAATPPPPPQLSLSTSLTIHTTGGSRSPSVQPPPPALLTPLQIAQLSLANCSDESPSEVFAAEAYRDLMNTVFPPVSECVIEHHGV